MSYHSSTPFTLGIPISWMCDDQKHTDSVDLVLIWHEYTMYNVAIIYILIHLNILKIQLQ